jgi:hypothetical protein
MNNSSPSQVVSTATENENINAYKKLHAGAHDLPFHKHVIAGAAAGLVEVLIMYPLDVVKTRLQLQHGTVNTKYTSVAQTFRYEMGRLQLHYVASRSLFEGISG